MLSRASHRHAGVRADAHNRVRAGNDSDPDIAELWRILCWPLRVPQVLMITCTVVLVVVSVALGAGITGRGPGRSGPTGQTARSSAFTSLPAPQTVSVWQTSYAAYDNDPAGSRAISYPGPSPRHSEATADLGTYTRPITLASDTSWLPAGTEVYAPRWRKYYVMEDDCAECDTNWLQSHFHHVDLYMSSSVNAAVVACEDAATKDQSENDVLVIHPAANYAVDTTPLYTTSGACVVGYHQYSNTLVTTGGTSSPSASPSPTSTMSTPVNIDKVPCTVTINGKAEQGSCSGTFMP